jgi:hypothetical protein
MEVRYMTTVVRTLILIRVYFQEFDIRILSR